MALLQGPSPKQLEMMKQEMGECPGDMERCVRDLRSMCAASPHLPQPDAFDSHFLELFVRGCRMDMALARRKLEAFCQARARYRDLYAQRSLAHPPLNALTEVIDITPLPKLTDEALRVTVFQFRRNYSETVDVADIVRAILLLSDARMRDECPIAGDVFVWDVSEIRASIVSRIPPAITAIRRGIHLAHAAYPQRLKRIHVLGASPLMASTLQFIRSCTGEKIKKRFYLHQKPEELLEHIPASVLPIEWGGEEQGIEILSKKWRHRVDEIRDFLRDLNELGNSSASLPKKDSDIYGTIGAFRKLEID